MITEDTILKTPTELIEGDIMILTHTVWKDYQMIFEVQKIDGELIFIHRALGFTLEFKENKKYPIIGNIKKNPDVLGGKKL